MYIVLETKKLLKRIRNKTLTNNDEEMFKQHQASKQQYLKHNPSQNAH